MRRSRSRNSEAIAARSAAALAALVAGCASAPVHPEARCPGDAVVVASQADVTRLASCTTARGLTLRTGGALDVSRLRALTTITGDLVIGPTVAVEEVTLGELRVVEGTIRVIGNGLLQGLFLPRLERAGAVSIEGNVAITTISLPRLAAVGALRVTDNANLELLDVPALASILGELVLTGDPKLTLVETHALHSAGRVELDAPQLPPELADRLRALPAPP